MVLKRLLSIVIFFPVLLIAQENTSQVDKIRAGLRIDGIDYELSYAGDFYNYSNSGVNKFYYLDNFNFDFNFNMNTLTGWNGTDLFLSILGNNGKDPNEEIGSIQGIDNIAAYNTWKIYQFFIDQKLLDNKLSILAGLFDLNSEFDTREYSGMFLNPSHGIGAEYALTGENGPSIFPTTSVAMRVSYDLTDNWNLRTAVFDGVSGDVDNPRGTVIKFGENDGLLLAGELTFSEQENDYFKYSLGGWYYTGEFESLNSTQIIKGNYGFYVSGEKSIYTNKNGSDIGVFLRAGLSDKSINLVNGYYGAGFQVSGVIPGVEEDAAGITIAIAHLNRSSVYSLLNGSTDSDDYEYIYEITYSITIWEMISIQPDLQYIVNPVYGDQSKTHFIYGARVNVIF